MASLDISVTALSSDIYEKKTANVHNFTK